MTRRLALGSNRSGIRPQIPPVSPPVLAEQLSGLDDLPTTRRVLERVAGSGQTLGGQLFAVRDDRVIADVGLGLATLSEPMSPEVPVRWFCALKPIVAAAFLRASREQRVELDEPVSGLVPGARWPQSPTWRHVLTHSVPFDVGLPPVSLPMPTVLERLLDQPLKDDFLPGQGGQYHLFAGWYLLGAAIEELTGRPLADALEALIFDPCGMTSTSLSAEHERQHGRVIASSADGALGVLSGSIFDHPVSRSIANPAFGGFGPIRDLGRFYGELLAAMQDPDRVLSAVAGELCRVQRPETFDAKLGYRCTMGLGILTELGAYGFGIPGPYLPRAVGHDSIVGRWGFAEPTTRTVVALCLNGFPRDHTADPRINRGTIPLIRAIYDDLR
jgi:CubicO group peptidase (beta-lactamase class C family)